jgi:hypothetical protein
MRDLGASYRSIAAAQANRHTKENTANLIKIVRIVQRKSLEHKSLGMVNTLN